MIGPANCRLSITIPPGKTPASLSAKVSKSLLRLHFCLSKCFWLAVVLHTSSIWDQAQRLVGVLRWLMLLPCRGRQQQRAAGAWARGCGPVWRRNRRRLRWLCGTDTHWAWLVLASVHCAVLDGTPLHKYSPEDSCCCMKLLWPCSGSDRLAVELKNGVAGRVGQVRVQEGTWREGLDLFSNVAVPYTNAILGGTTQVSTVRGNATLDIPPGEPPSMAEAG